MPPFVRWDEFQRRVRFRQGDHITIVGTTGSGKTVLARELLFKRDYVIVLGTKNTDPELYGPLVERGFEIVEHFDATPEGDEPKRVIFRPRLTTPDKKGLARQADRFREVLYEVFKAGGWAVYADEIFYVADKLGLSDVFEILWTTGRTEDITVIASTQLPVRIPLVAFDQAVHLFLFRNADQQRVRRMAEFSGSDVDLVRYVIPRLPLHEFLYVDTRSGMLMRSKVLL